MLSSLGSATAQLRREMQGYGCPYGGKPPHTSILTCIYCAQMNAQVLKKEKWERERDRQRGGDREKERVKF